MTLRADDVSKDVEKAVKRSRLDQAGTKPFHLKAEITPVSDRDKALNRSGEIEIWWKSPEAWRREVRSPEFHQVEIVNDGQVWQKNEGEYFPEWLRSLAVELIDPVPPLDHVLQEVKSADVRSFMGQTNAQWMTMGSDGTVSKGIGAGVALSNSTGLLVYGSDVGWSGDFHDYQEFHGRMVARAIGDAKIVLLEDLGSEPADFFDATASGGDAQQISTLVVDEPALRKNMIASDPVPWPSLANGPLTGVLTTEIVVDREGRVRNVGTIVSDNPGLSDVARAWIMQQRFKPYLVNGVPVQVVSTMTLPFTTTRPAGTENFDSARNYFERGRKAGFPAAGAGTPYSLSATFQAMGSDGKVADGRYEDIWVNEGEWRREAWFGKSHYVRTQNGDKRYQLAEGPDAALLRLVFKVIEPIPALDTFVESDWRMKREDIADISTVRVATGPEDASGKMVEGNSRAFWFDQNGWLLQAVDAGVHITRGNFVEFDGAQVAQSIVVRAKGGVVMIVKVGSLQESSTINKSDFVLKGHEYKRQFTDEVR
ncbi:energy transducer TonB [Edaphobacter acidisoli]|uniref:energy transducer TonB n=1 Tax=Edaphobacter acidisoli TaxID=2040573 RepID=UPI001E3279DF|nr:energy transducer TonB [Edaphobacter acidisoli]